MGTNKRNRGFTLIEMAIVLTIVGLIVGAILTGQSVIRQSMLNSAVADEQRYVQAVASFQQKYTALPGDFATAGLYWTAGTCTTLCSTFPASTTTTCSGDGNGQIGVYYNSGSPTTCYPEEVMFWQHLSLAQMITGNYNASAGAGTSSTFYSTDHVLGTNAPASKLTGAGFGVEYIGSNSVNGNGATFPANTISTAPALNMGHIMTFGAYLSKSVPVGPIMTAAEAYGIDLKFDDGVPTTGNIQTWLSTAPSGYATSCTSSTTAYSLNTGYLCSLFFVTGF